MVCKLLIVVCPLSNGPGHVSIQLLLVLKRAYIFELITRKKGLYFMAREVLSRNELIAWVFRGISAALTMFVSVFIHSSSEPV